MIFGIINIISVIYLSGIVAFVLAMGEEDAPRNVCRRTLGCWAKLLGALVAVGLVVYILSLFAG